MHKHILLSMDNTLMMSSLMTSIATLLSGVVTHPVGNTEAMAGFLDNNKSPSLIILDMEMRDNMGIAILKLLVERKIQVSLILINTRPSDYSGIRLDDMNIAGQFKKPLDYRTLYGTIRKALEEKAIPQA
ncbi:MAG: response regulator [Candidatus Omnitrophica bacterium]|nr:response regulator [Candidatus Omnitrophota bacterium]